MGFTTPCFIRKSTYKLRKKLEELGYRLFGAELNEDLCIFTEPEYGLYSVEFFSNIPHPDETDSVDCGTNEELFLAIAALRDDTNENQLFICDVNHWDRSDNGEATVYAEIGEWIFCKSNDDDCARDNHYHKATVEELIEHFKEKEE